MHKTPLWLWLMLWWLPSAANGQAAFTLTADQLQNGQAVELDKLGCDDLSRGIRTSHCGALLESADRRCECVLSQERRVNVAIAGMPPLLVYRQATNTVERINLTGLPLGSVTSYRYRETTTEMQPGDVLLLLSDGLTELFNPADEMFGEERVEQCLQASAQSAPDEIIAQLLAAAEAWTAGRKLEDDLTLVVLKAK